MTTPCTSPANALVPPALSPDARAILSSLRQIGGSLKGRLSCTYARLLQQLGEANATELDDPDKVAASWGFIDQHGREGFVWSYNTRSWHLPAVTSWSVDGNRQLLDELFPGQIEWL